MNTELQIAINDARHELLQSSRWHVSLPRRDTIWTALGPRSRVGNKATINAGLIRRTKLCALCVEKVVPLFEKTASALRGTDNALVNDEDHPRLIIELAQARARDEVTWDAAWQRSVRYGTMLQYSYELLPIYEREALVLHAAGATLGAALFDLGGYSAGLSDNDRDTWDADLYASWAFSGSAPWEESGSDTDRKRKQFWLWYLDDAVPAAWAAVTDADTSRA